MLLPWIPRKKKKALSKTPILLLQPGVMQSYSGTMRGQKQNSAVQWQLWPTSGISNHISNHIWTHPQFRLLFAPDSSRRATFAGNKSSHLTPKTRQSEVQLTVKNKCDLATPRPLMKGRIRRQRPELKLLSRQQSTAASAGPACSW